MKKFVRVLHITEIIQNKKEGLKMGMFDFRRCDGFVGYIPHYFIDNKFLKCPMCDTQEPY